MVTDLLNLPATLERWDLTVVEVTGWEDRRRPGRFDPIGVLIHHTAGPRGKDAPSLQVCIDGRSDLPGPLCQLLVARSGKVYVISIGKANHAGTGRIPDHVPADLGNIRLLGIEAENDGIGEPWPAAQVDAMVRATAAVLDLLGQPRTNVWGHREYAPGRKIDPTGIDMALFRADVAAAQPPGGTVPTDNPYPAETAEALELLAQHAGYVGDRLWFGPLALEALHRLKNDKLALAAANKTSADTMVRIVAERDAAKANREAAEAEVAMLRKQLQEGGRTPQLLADLDDLRAKFDAIGMDLADVAETLEAAIAKARA